MKINMIGGEIGQTIWTYVILIIVVCCIFLISSSVVTGIYAGVNELIIIKDIPDEQKQQTRSQYALIPLLMSFFACLIVTYIAAKGSFQYFYPDTEIF